MIELFHFSIHGGGDHGDGVASLVAHFLVVIEQVANQPLSATLASLMPGIGTLANLHPLIVHYPIAFLSLFWLLDSIARLTGHATLRSVASSLLYLGTVSAGLAVWAGLNAAETIAHDGTVHDIMEQHKQLAFAVLSVAGVLTLWRLALTSRGIVGALHNLTALALLILVALTADLGGFMVYQHGVAVAKVKWPAQHAHSHDNEPTPGRVAPHSHGHQTAHDHDLDHALQDLDAPTTDTMPMETEPAHEHPPHEHTH
ncbi:MAG: DUF2231 domain-containing protein [Methylococcales bacterium]|nr:DUF2231 domain-containing protein [Methylococcales bacterium]